MSDTPPRGRLHVWLSYAAGVGKTYTVLGVAHRLRERGQDVVVGFVETHGRAPTAALLEGLEVVPRRRMRHQDAWLEEMDVAAVLARHPQVAVVDEPAHTNVPGSRHEKRWQDVEELLTAGITVLTTLNIQHLESLNDTVERITGVAQRETIPDAAVRAADQIDLVDVAPEQLRRRLARGDIYPPERIDAALAHFFREGNLTALRELALLWLADRVDEELLTYMARHEIRGPWETRERVVVALSGQGSNQHLVRRAARMAARRGGDLIGVLVVSDDGLVGSGGGELEGLRSLVSDLGGTFHEVVGSDVPRALLQFARAENATQLVLGASRRSRLAEILRGSVVTRVVRDAGPIDVHIISQDEPGAGAALPRTRRLPAVPRRRQVLGALAGMVGLVGLTPILVVVRDRVALSTVFLLYLCVVAAIAALGGWWPAAAGAVAAFFLVNWYFVPPLHQWDVASPENAFALGAFVAVGGLVSLLMARSARLRMEAGRSRAQAEALTRMAAVALEERDPLPALVDRLRATFGAEAVTVLVRSGAAWQVLAGSGSEPPGEPATATTTLPLGEDAVLALRGGPLAAEDREVLGAFAAHLAAAVRNRQLEQEAAAAAREASLNQLRSTILNAVSHDLRTPLASIKAAVSSLRQTDVAWSETDRGELLATIEEEADRLNALVGNLLDMSRLQVGALSLVLRPIGFDEVVPRALRYVQRGESRVEVHVPETLPRVNADPALLERAIANVADNALAWSPAEQPVRIGAFEVAGRVELRVVDQGPGLPPEVRERAFEPFQRFGDRPWGEGIGLGLAVAKGFVEAMGGTIDLEDTPGGGLTVCISLEAA
ncbi:MAG: sensor histidine kinase KdpD [Acidimicrobiia bacterium]|nr:sensor histidine kinase KdpD [Acidimicrobiia bacterium]